MKRINILSSVANVFIIIGLLMCMISDGETYCNLDVSNALFLRDRSIETGCNSECRDSK